MISVSQVGENISLVIYVSRVGGTHITRDMCFPDRGTHIISDICFPGRGTHITRKICFPERETHITADMCFLGRGRYITRQCVSRVGEHISLGTYVFPG